MNACNGGDGIGGHFQDKNAVFGCQSEVPHHSPRNRLGFQAQGAGGEHVCGRCPGLGGLEAVDHLVTHQTVAPVFVRHLILNGYGSARHHPGDRFSRINRNVAFIAVSPVRVGHFVLNVDFFCKRCGGGLSRGCGRSKRKIYVSGFFRDTVPSGPAYNHSNEDGQHDNGRLKLFHAECKLNFLHQLHLKRHWGSETTSH